MKNYEKEGLLNRTARNTFNYREYTEEDVEQLQRIKILRLLEVPIEEIRLYKDDKVILNEIIQEKMKELQGLASIVVSKKENV